MSLPRTKNILSILKPMELKEEITNISNLIEVVLQNTSKYTILPKDFFDSVLDDAHLFKSVEGGEWVQVGVWKGGGSLFFKSLMDELKIDENLYLYDTFGKTPTNLINGKKDLEFIKSFNSEGQTKPYLVEVQKLFGEFNLSDNVYFIESDVNELKKQDVPESIAFLFIDVDFYDPTLSALNSFYDNVIPGGIIVIDDYYLELVNCKDAVDDFFYSRHIDIATCGKKFSSYSILITKPE